MISGDKQHFLIGLRQILSTRLSEEELRSLCFDLGVDYENLGGESKAARARNLISYFDRRERLDELAAACRSSLPDLPWESLLASQTPVSSPASPAQAPPGMVKILFLAANPVDTPMLRLDLEVKAIEKTLRQTEYRQRFELIQQWAVQVSDLQGLLLRYEPDIVHFSGHGSPYQEIILEEEAGNSHPVSARVLSQLFSILKDNIRCVVLNACYSEPQAQAIAQQIDCVIGMSKAISDPSAISFATAFYQALGYGKDIKTAFDLGCLQIDLKNLNDQDVPKLLALNCDPSKIVLVR